eukprot:IDg23103t1
MMGLTPSGLQEEVKLGLETQRSAAKIAEQSISFHGGLAAGRATTVALEFQLGDTLMPYQYIAFNEIR